MPNNPITLEQVSQRLLSISEYCHVLVSTELDSSGYTHTHFHVFMVCKPGNELSKNTYRQIFKDLFPEFTGHNLDSQGVKSVTALSIFI